MGEEAVVAGGAYRPVENLELKALALAREALAVCLARVFGTKL
jgi:hypothetical protein